MAIKVLYQGEWLTLNAIAKKRGIPKATLWTRYSRGIRGEELFEKTVVKKRGRPQRASLPETTALLSQFATLPRITDGR